MRKAAWKKASPRRVASIIPGIFIFVTIAVLVIVGLTGVKRGSTEEGQKILEQSLRRAAVSCYAIEGRYPPSLDYLTRHYGVVIDGSKYEVFYTGVFASNIMPEITVIAKEGR
ncbi:MAG: hypothetical protein GX572_01765 [Clostridia bacterium]|nr:hypothetical protein [Clostridia bacterium]